MLGTPGGLCAYRDGKVGWSPPSCLPSDLALPDGPPIFGGEDRQIAALDGPYSVGLWRVLPSTLRIQDASCFPLPKFGAKVLARFFYEIRCLIGAKLILHANILTGDSAHPATQFRAVEANVMHGGNCNGALNQPYVQRWSARAVFALMC